MKAEDYLYIPAEVRYSKSLPPNAKLLFEEIAQRANDEGKALFLYDELPELFNVNKKAVYLWVNALEDQGFLISKMIRRRRIHYLAFILPKQPGKPQRETF